jgi:hypothetical protein
MTDRVEKLLTMLLLEQLGTAPQGRKIEVLLRVGFKNAEIATLLGTTPAVVAQTAYASKKGKTKPGKARTGAKPRP